MPQRAFIVDDHPIVRRGLRDLLTGECGLECCGEAGSAEEALEAIPGARPHLVIVDISLGGANGLELVKGLHARHPHMPVLVLSVHDEGLYAERALAAGASGYVMKDRAPEELGAAITEALAGGIYLSPSMSRRVLRKVHGKGDGGGAPEATLSDREIEVFERLGEGLSTREIADSLHLSVKTVESYRAGIKRKLDIRNASELVRRAVIFKERMWRAGPPARRAEGANGPFLLVQAAWAHVRSRAMTQDSARSSRTGTVAR